MKTFFNKAILILMLLVIILNQVEPVAALQPKAPSPAAAPALEAATQAAGQRGIGKKATKPKLYNQPQAPEPTKPTIKLSANPKFITGDAVVTVHWAIQHDLPKTTGLTLKITFPKGYTPTNSSGYTAATQTLSIPVNAASGNFMLNVQNPLDNAIFPVTLLDSTQQTLAETSLSLPKHEKFNAAKSPSTSSGQMPTFSAQQGRVKVKFGKDSLPEDAIIHIGAPAGDAIPKHSLSGRPFEIEAQGVKSKKDLRQFAGEVAIDVNYSDLNLQGENENNLYLYYYDPTTDNWYALPTVVDPKTKTLHATTTHFTVYDMGINNWQASRMPTVDSFQVSTYTGAATYSLPIEVPAGPGGLQPNLNLSYNSQVIDQSTAQTQASWVGMGWSLGMNTIELNDQGTSSLTGNASWYKDDTWSINVNGISSTIVKNGSSYRAADENFMKLEHNPTTDSWQVWDKRGNTYFFNKQAQTVYQKTGSPSSNCAYLLVTYQWTLTRMENIFGQALTYTYGTESKPVPVPVWNNNQCSITGSVSLVTASYPDLITYPGGRYRVRFVRTARADYPHAWLTDVTYHSFQRSLLYAILTEQADGSGDGTFDVISKYEFEYASNNPANWGTTADGVTHAPVWPGITWNTSGKTTTLLRVHQRGVGGVDELPSATFSYGDKMHLTRADNGYGGSIAFTYESWAYTPRARLSQRYPQSFDWGNTCSTAGFVAYPAANYANINCTHVSNTQNFLWLQGQAVIPGNWLNQSNARRPGGFYKFTFTEVQPAGGIGLEYGMSVSDNPADVVRKTYNFSAPDELKIIQLPASASKSDLLLNATGTDNPSKYLLLGSVMVELLPSIYRVEERAISDGDGHTDRYSYNYFGEAFNDSAHSVGACPDAELDATPPTCQQYNEKYSEFRGHSWVAEIAPDGHQTLTNFNQSDLFKGRPNSVTVKDASGKKLSEQLTSYQNVVMPMDELVGGPNQWGYRDGQFHNWVTTRSEENRIYNSDGVNYNATKTSYIYEGASGCDANDICTYTGANTFGNLISKTEWAKNGTAWGKYRKTGFSYFHNVTSSLYLASLPNSQLVTDASGATLAQTFNLYDNNSTWNVQPSAGKLTAVRTLVSGANYSQIGYEYDNWGNRIKTKTYTSYGTSDTAPTSPAIVQATGFDNIYHTYPIWQQTPLVAGAPGFITQFTYGNPALGQPCTPLAMSCTQTDPNGVATIVHYDKFGRLTKVIKAGDTFDLPTLQVVYNDTVQPFRIDLAQKVNATSYYMIQHTYDGLGREIKTVTGSGGFGGSAFAPFNAVKQEYYYDANNNNQRTTKQSTPYNPGQTPTYFTTSTYDLLGRPDKITVPDGSITDYSYNGLITTVTDANNHTTTTLADVWGRTERVTPPLGPIVEYDYDPLGQLTDITRGTGYQTHLEYDKAGRKIEMDDPDMGVWYYKYDALGNLTAQVDANQAATNLYYDALNRLVGKTYSAVPVLTPSSYTPPADPGVYPVRYSYDAGTNGKGRRTRIDDESGFTSWTYDTRGRAVSETKNITGAGTFISRTSYNAADMPLTITYPDTEIVTNTYTPQMMLDSVTGSETYINGTTYDVAGRMNTRILGNDTQTKHTYYPWNQQGGRLAMLQSGTASNPGSLQNLVYTYDSIGNIETIADNRNAQTQFFTYDLLDRLTIAKACTTDANNNCVSPATGTGQSNDPNGLYFNGYGYNAATGNLETKAGLILYYNDVEHKHAVTSSSNGNSYIYDKNGNQTQRTVNGQTYNLTYNVEGRLISVQATTTPLPTRTITPTPSKTLTRTVTTTASPSGTVTKTRTVTATPTKTMTGTVTATPSKTQTGVVTAILTASPTATATEEIIATSTETATPTEETTQTETPTPTAEETAIQETPTETETISPEETATEHPTATSTPTAASPQGEDITASPTPDTSTLTPTPIDTPTLVGSTATLPPTLTSTLTPTPIPPTKTVTKTVTKTATKTATATVTNTPTPAPFTSATFTYDADGKMVKSVIGGVTTLFVSAVYQIQAGVVTKYYSGGAFRVGGVLYYGFGDHLGSTSVTTNASGVKIAEMRYKAWGEVRYSSGDTHTDKTYTGQRSYTNDFGLTYYNARWYDSTIGRFAQADTIIPNNQGVQGLDRFAYVNNDPMNGTDPSGHKRVCTENNYMGHMVTTCTGTNDHYDNTGGHSFSDWELKVLNKLRKAGAEGAHAADYLYTHNTSFDNLSEQNGTGAAWDPNPFNSNTISFPKAGGLPAAEDPGALGLIAHEAMHLEQNERFPYSALSAYGELEAWQVGMRVTKNMGLPNPLGADGELIDKLPLSNESIVLSEAVILMQRQQNGPSLIGPNYPAGWLLLLTIPSGFPNEFSRP